MFEIMNWTIWYLAFFISFSGIVKVFTTTSVSTTSGSTTAGSSTTASTLSTSISGSTTEVACGAAFDSEVGNFSSPNHPQEYPPDADCYYEITVPEGKLVKLDFKRVEVEFHSICDYDWIVIEKSTFSNNRLCGTELRTFYSVNNRISVSFHSDSSKQKEGFYAEFTSILPSEVPVTAEGPITTDDCPADITALSGAITSDNFPNNYSPSIMCTMKIIVPSGRKILIQFTNFNLEESEDCEYDYVAVFNGKDDFNELCGTDIPPNKLSDTNELYIQFVSDGNTQKSGFSAEFIAVDGQRTQTDWPEESTTGIVRTTSETTIFDVKTISTTIETTTQPETETDLMTLLLVIVGVILLLGVIALVSGLLFCHFSKNKVQTLKSSKNLKKKRPRKAVDVKDLPAWPTLKKVPPVKTTSEAQEKSYEKTDLAVIDC